MRDLRLLMFNERAHHMAKQQQKKAAGRPTSKPTEHDDAASVDAYMESLKHPLKSVVEAVRKTILGADMTITEGIKWNSPSFYCRGWFASINIRPKHGVLVVLHHGAKTRSNAELGSTLDDPSKLLQWMGKDRATVAFIDDADFKTKQSAFKNIIKQWATYQAKLGGVG
jgi:hypothetical protein